MKKVSNHINVYILEICCCFCYYDNLHSGHKLVKLSDTEALKKENITIESVTSEFNELSTKVKDLKNKIETEINKINESYEKTIEHLTKSYLKKHEVLLKEENDLKEKLQNEVTKIKEKLENFLSQSNNDIKLSERINKGIKKLENEDKNMIKILSYVSKINKTQKNMKQLFTELMKNIKFNYEEEKSNIKYEEYYFNGIPIPKNIEFKDVSSSSLNISWNIDNINIIDFDNNKMKYKLEMRKENDKFQEIYEGNETKYNINNLKKNTNYEFRICCFYNNLIGRWTEIQKIKTKDFDSVILRESKRENEFIKKIYDWTGLNEMELIFRGTRDGMTNTAFHNKCDSQGATITIIKNDKGYIFGGYASVSWINDKNNTYHSAPDSFLFTLTNIHPTQPTKFPSKNDTYEVKCYSGYGPAFGGGHDLGIYPDILNKGGWTGFPSTYQDVLGKGKSIFTNDSNNGNFKVNEIEVFKIFK